MNEILAVRQASSLGLLFSATLICYLCLCVTLLSKHRDGQKGSEKNSVASFMSCIYG